jgi:peptidoglycan/LPS O-acetylase OafA/YrhL
LRYLGRRSYAIYLWHFALLLAITNVADSIWMGVVAVIIAIGVAELSWIYVESPFLTRSGGALQGVTRGARPQRGKVSSHSVP